MPDEQKETLLLQNYTVGQISIKHNETRGMECPLHFHDCFELELITEGHGYQILNGERLELHPRSLSLLGPLDYHTVRTDGSDVVKTCTVMIHPSLVPEDYYDMVLRRTHFLNLDSATYEQIGAIFKAIETAACSDRNFEDAYYTHLIACFFSVFDKLTTGTAAHDIASGSSDFRQLLSYVGLHFRENPSVGEIAERFHYSPNYVSRLFEKHLGKTFVHYLTDQKIEYAARLLRTTDLPITQICFECGFGSFANFSRVFRRKTGQTPSEYKRTTGGAF